MQSSTRRVGAALAMLAATAALAAEPAANYPGRPVRWVVPFTPGASNDIIARLVGQKLGDAWGQQ
ncbi:MAG: tripartite tricarboxylate transporter substrate binding protein, partial [Burkholderiales bacterium]